MKKLRNNKKRILFILLGFILALAVFFTLRGSSLRAQSAICLPNSWDPINCKRCNPYGTGWNTSCDTGAEYDECFDSLKHLSCEQFCAQTPTPTPILIPTPTPILIPTPTPTPETCDPQTSPCPQTWTFMFYSFNAPDLLGQEKTYIYDKIQEMIREQSPILRCINIVYSHKTYNTLSHNASCTTNVFKMNGSKLEEITTQRTNNVVCPELEDFIVNSQNQYPADYFYLGLINHGDPTGIGILNNPYNGSRIMTHTQIANAINLAVSQTDRRINVLEHIACATGIVENSAELSENVDYLISWQSSRPVNSYNFERITHYLNPCSNLSPAGLASGTSQGICDTETSSAIAFSAVNLKTTPEINQKINGFFGKLANNCQETKNCAKKAVDEAQRTATLGTCPPSNPLCPKQPIADLIDLAEKIIDNCSGVIDAQTQQEGIDLINKAREAIINNCNRSRPEYGYDYSNAHGIAAYIPQTANQILSTSASLGQGWINFLKCVLP